VRVPSSDLLKGRVNPPASRQDTEHCFGCKRWRASGGCRGRAHLTPPVLLQAPARAPPTRRGPARRTARGAGRAVAIHFDHIISHEHSRSCGGQRNSRGRWPIRRCRHNDVHCNLGNRVAALAAHKCHRGIHEVCWGRNSRDPGRAIKFSGDAATDTLPHKQDRSVKWAISHVSLRRDDGSEIDLPRIGLSPLSKILYDAYRCMSEHTAAFHPRFPVLKPDQKPIIAVEEEHGSDVCFRLNHETVWAVQGLPWSYIEHLREAVRFAPENQRDFPEVAGLSVDEVRSRLFPRETKEMSEHIDAYLQQREARCKQRQQSL